MEMLEKYWTGFEDKETEYYESRMCLSYDGVNYYALVRRGNAGIIETDTGIRVTSLERTVMTTAVFTFLRQMKRQ